MNPIKKDQKDHKEIPILIHFSNFLSGLGLTANKSSQNSSAQNPFAKIITRGNGPWPYDMVQISNIIYHMWRMKSHLYSSSLHHTANYRNSE